LGANPAAVDENGDTALIHAARNGNVDLFRAILSKYDNRIHQNKHKKNATQIANEHAHSEIVSCSVNYTK
tara:strand:- start:567 stop:776 length:210 start_codon:yes stop_codon:yes gene_type:complete